MQEAFSIHSAATLWRETDPDRINAVVNHPAVNVWGRSPQQIDASPSMSALIALFGQHGGYVFWRVSPVIFEACSAVLPEGRGEWAVGILRVAIKWMFKNGGALEIMLSGPKGARRLQSGVFAKLKCVGEIEDGWWVDGRSVSSEIYSLLKSDWEKCQLN
jgi:hypothetical protein